MKKTILFLAVALCLCCQAKAQDMALAFNNTFGNYSQTGFQTDLTEQPTYSNASELLYLAPSPSEALGTQQMQSPRVAWGITCIAVGGTDILAGGVLLLEGLLVKSIGNATPEFPDMPEMKGDTPDDPDMPGDPTFNDAANMTSKVFTIAGISSCVLGAGLVTTGILLIKSNGKSSGGSGVGSSNSNRPKNTRNSKESKKYKHIRHTAELLTPYEPANEWTLSFNASPSNCGLTLTF